MKQFGKMMLLAFGFGLLAVVLSSIPNHPVAASGSAPVTVVGGVTGATPVPVSLQGTGNISGNVNAAQSGTWSVGITGTPTVNLGAGNIVGISGTPSVTVSNTSTSTLFVDTDGPAREAVSGHCGTSFTGSGGATCTLVSVPSGKILVIDTISAAVTPLAGKAVNDVACDVPVTDINDSSTTNRFHIGVPLEGSDGAFDWYLSTIRVAIYAAGGKNVSCFANTQSTTGGSMAFNFAGHLVTP